MARALREEEKQQEGKIQQGECKTKPHPREVATEDLDENPDWRIKLTHT